MEDNDPDLEDLLDLPDLPDLPDSPELPSTDIHSEIPCFDLMEEEPSIPSITELPSITETLLSNNGLFNSRQELTEALQVKLLGRHRYRLNQRAKTNAKNMKIEIPTSDFDINQFPSIKSCLRTIPFDHQKRGSMWMLSRETLCTNDLAPYLERFEHDGMPLVYNSIEERFYTSSNTFQNIKGGILGDDMGLGKTIQILLLILMNPPPGKIYRGDVDEVEIDQTDVEADDENMKETFKGKKRMRVTDNNEHCKKRARSETTSSSFCSIRPSLDTTEAQDEGKLRKSKKSRARALDELGSRALDELGSHRDYEKYNMEQLKEFARLLSLPIGQQKAQLITSLNEIVDDHCFSRNEVGPTLLICPLAVMQGWIDQVNTHLRPNSLKVYLYYDTNRNISPEELYEYDLVVTNYHTLNSDFHEFDVTTSMLSHLANEHKNSSRRKAAPRLRRWKQTQKKERDRKLFQIVWHRIVLDEGHMIRNSDTRIAKACFNLEAKHRWVLSGTSIINGVKDMGSYYRFLRLEPFFSNSNLFEKKLVKPFLYKNSIAIDRVHTINNIYSIRRTKTEIPDLGLPVKTENVKIVPFNAKEEEAYQALRSVMHQMIQELYNNHGRDDHILRSNYISIRALIMRLRQCCLDFRLVPRHALESLLCSFRLRASSRASSSSSNQPIEKNTELLDKKTRDEMLTSLVSYFQAVFERDELPEANQTERELMKKGENITSSSSSNNRAFVPCMQDSECPICSELLLPSSTACLTRCKHRVCIQCLNKWTTNKIRKTCPVCREPFDPTCGYTLLEELVKTIEKEKETETEDIDLENIENEEIEVSPNEYVSSKTRAVLEHVQRIIAEKPDDKVVIFSSFVGYIKILESTFEREGISFLSILGSTSQKERADFVSQFQTSDDSPKIMFCSLRAAGVGITLHRANHCLLTDLWWNNPTDQQAIDRIYRIGQQKQVYITRFLIRGAIDEGILQLQVSKLDQAKSVEKGNYNPEDRKREELRSIKQLIGLSDNNNDNRLLRKITDEDRDLFDYRKN